MHYITFIASLFAAVTVVGAIPALEQRTKTCYQTDYVCPSTADSLECCTGAISAAASKTGCSPCKSLANSTDTSHPILMQSQMTTTQVVPLVTLPRSTAVVLPQ